jgi:hypothetical protein
MVLLVACSGNTPEATRQVVIGEVQVTVVSPTQENYVFKTSEPGTITVHGQLIVLDPMSMVPASEDAIYLVPMPIDDPIAAIPQFEVGTVPQADVNEINGEFMFTNIQPDQYAVVVITPGGAQIPVRKMDTKSYAIFTLDASQVDTTVDIGFLTLP